jgi:CheY-like chemotaxis protein
MSTRSTKGPDAPSARILLVDDNRSGLAARSAVLQEQGYQTVGKSDPREAVATFADGAFDVVVTDYRMPHMDGTELIQQLRAINPHIPVVLISGYADALGLTEKSTGANAVIMKSSHEVPHLVRAVRQLITNKQRTLRKQARKTPGSQGGAPALRKSRAAS